MSASGLGGVYSAFEPVRRHRALICGVCVQMAESVGVPVWVPRTAFILLAIQHALLAALLYVGAAALCHRRATPAASARPARQPWQPEAGGDSLRDRFSRLEARLAAMEAEALHNETDLRQGFRDLDSK